MRASRQHFAPRHSPAHQALHAAALEKGLDGQALHWLLRGINAHDQLLAHARVMGHLADWLAAIARGDFGPTSHLGAWTLHVPEWQTLCAWIRDERATLSQHAGLEALDRGLGRGHKHPMLYHGVDTFPLVSALWNRHERWDATAAARPGSAAARYERLQVHLLLGYLDARWALELAKLQSYDDHDDEHEHLYTHLPSRDAARAVREFSFQRHAAALEILRPELDVHAFRQRIASSREVTGAIARMPSAERRYLEYLRRFFQRVGQITAGMGPRRTGASRYAGGAPRSRRPIAGYVGWLDEAFGLRRRQHGPGSDPDDPDSLGDDALLWQDDAEADAQDGASPSEIEESGLAPHETWEPAFEWVSPAEYGQRLRLAAWGSAARQSAAQHYPWDWRVLCDAELRRLWKHLQNAMQESTGHKGSQARYRRMAALMLSTMLVLGQPLARVQRLWRKTLPAGQSPGHFAQPIEDLCLCVCKSQILGFALPALSPPYRSRGTQEVSWCARPHLPAWHAYLLPDVGGLGVALLQWAQDERSGGENEWFFRVELPKAHEEAQRLLDEIEGPGSRYTLSRVERALPSRLLAQTGDLSLVWLALAQREHAAQPRLYYTQHSVARLQDAYAAAAAALLQACASTASATVPEPLRPPTPVGVGARFVIAREALRTRLQALCEHLARAPQATPQALIDYHEHYQLYTYLMTALCTGVRTLRRSMPLWRAWRASGSLRDGCLVGLADKELELASRARLLALPPRLTLQYAEHARHLDRLRQRLAFHGHFEQVHTDEPMYVGLNANAQQMLVLEPDVPAQRIEQRWHQLMGAKVALNFARAFLRTELLQRGVHAELVDALLGHANQGEAPYAVVSSWDPDAAVKTLSFALQPIWDELGLKPVPSQFAA